MSIDRIVFMADVIDSTHKNAIELAKELKKLTSDINSECNESVISPMTITLGDEYQGVCKSVFGAVEIILYTESWLLRKSAKFNLRYVVYEGKIDTPINTESSYGMLGSGLTNARQELSSKNKSGSDVCFKLKDTQQAKLYNCLFVIVSGIKDLPARNKYPQILNQMLFSDASNLEIAKDSGKDPSEIWKFRRNWKIEVWLSAITILKERLYS